MIATVLAACGQEAAAPFRAAIDGDRPIRHEVTAELREWLVEPRKSMFLDALVVADHVWNPRAVGELQVVEVGLDKGDVLYEGENPCKARGFSLWSIWGTNKMYVCSAWGFCVKPTQTSTHYGPGGCLVAVLHEDGHLLGLRGHLPQNGRPQHNAGPIMQGWSSDGIDPTLTDFTAEDVAAICADGGHGGRCGAR